MREKHSPKETAETLARKQRDISVSEFFLKNRHLLGFDSPRRALLTAVKEAVDNALDACEEGGILPEISVEMEQVRANRFRVSVTDNGPGIVRAQIPRIFAKLLYGSKFHRLRMSRGQQGIGISAAVMYGQLTTGVATRILSRTGKGKPAHLIEVHIDTSRNAPAIVKDQELEWRPGFPGEGGATVASEHGTCVTIEMEAAYVRGRLSVDEYLKQCAIANPHLQLHFRVKLLKDAAPAAEDASAAASGEAKPEGEAAGGGEWTSFARAVEQLPHPPTEIKPHPHGVELGMLMQMLKTSEARTLRSMLSQDFSRVSSRVADEICALAKLEPKASPARIAHKESEALFEAINTVKLMRPPTDCLAPIGEEQILAGLKKEIAADFYTAVTRPPAVYRGNPFQIEVGLAYAPQGAGEDLGADEPVRLMRFANRVPLLYMGGGCAITKAVTGVNWKAYRLAQPKGSLPLGPVVLMVHMASVWVPFTSESKEAIAHYPEILKEMAFALQECGRRLATYLGRHRREQEALRKREYISLYLPHLALGLKQILNLDEKAEQKVLGELKGLLERSHLEE